MESTSDEVRFKYKLILNLDLSRNWENKAKKQ